MSEAKRYEEGWRPEPITRDVVNQMLDIVYSKDVTNEEALQALHTIWMAIDPLTQEKLTEDAMSEWVNPSEDEFQNESEMILRKFWDIGAQ